MAKTLKALWQYIYIYIYIYRNLLSKQREGDML